MKISAIVPAYNEEGRIDVVLSALIKTDEIGEIIVVDDGSTDDTFRIARDYEVDLISHDCNKGKACALSSGVKEAKYDIFLFLDADLKGIKEKHVRKMVSSYEKGESDVVIGVFHNGRLNTDLSQKINPYLSGQRILSRDIWERLSKRKAEEFGVETAMAKLILKEGLKVEKVKLEGVTHVMKEEKRGFGKGLKSRLQMYGDIIKTVFSRS